MHIISAITIFILFFLFISSSNAQPWGQEHCWWDGSGMRCVPGYQWNREHRHEEELQHRQWHEERDHREWCEQHPRGC